jgi:hypothetical protein
MPLFKFATIRLYFITDWTEMNHKRDSSKHAGSLNISIPATVFDLDANV